MFTDRLGIVHPHAYDSFHRFQSGETDRVLFHAFLILSLAIFLMIGKTNQSFHSSVRGLLHPSVLFPTLYHRFPLYSGNGIYRSIFTAFSGRSINLTAPFQEVGRNGISKGFSGHGSRPKAMPLTILPALQQLRTKHFLSASPRAEIGS